MWPLVPHLVLGAIARPNLKWLNFNSFHLQGPIRMDRRKRNGLHHPLVELTREINQLLLFKAGLLSDVSVKEIPRVVDAIPELSFSLYRFDPME